jgi:cytochrome c556
MKRSMAGTALVAFALLVPGLAVASIGLAPIMRHWHQTQRQIDAMLTGGQAYDPAAAMAAARLYVVDAQAVSAHVTGKSAVARDFAARFAQFAEDAKAAEAASATAAAFRPHAQRLSEDCQACHAIYNN